MGCLASQSSALCSVFQIFLAVRCGRNHQIAPAGRGGGDLKGSLGRDVPPRHQTLTLFETKIAHFGHFATPL